jgi:hypothetical protein
MEINIIGQIFLSNYDLSRLNTAKFWVTGMAFRINQVLLYKWLMHIRLQTLLLILFYN